MPQSTRSEIDMRWRAGSVLFVAALLAALGCAPTGEPSDAYGRRHGEGSVSLAGTSVLARMIEGMGGSVATWSRISPKLDEYDVIVWFPDDFDAPGLRQRTALEDWLANGANRRLVYVGRDYDATSQYWRDASKIRSPNQWEAANRLARARTTHDWRRNRESPEEQYARWFLLKGSGVPRPARRLTSNQGWLEDVDTSRTELVVGAQLDRPTRQDVPAPTAAVGGGLELPMERREWQRQRYFEKNDAQLPIAQVLLNSEHGPLVQRVTDNRWGNSELLVVTNGGFLLNLPLVNSEHRKLAARLLETCDVADRRVVFLESTAGGPPVYEQELEDTPPNGLELFTVWPIGFVMVHLLGLGLLSCFVLYPTFGRPRELPEENTSDFGRHIDAVGDLLAQTKSEMHVTEVLRQYHTAIKRESGATHASKDDGRAATKTSTSAESKQPPSSPS
ncbi:MAG: DUF4350 domain-containing protein [Planctomycetales bacterium]|nr:DUF4350 domain-containing protein [Planctomycetales bacterium]